MDNGTVKIGMSVNVNYRIATILSNSGLEVLRCCFSEGLTNKEVRAIETACKNFFSSKRARGEFFNITYEDAQAHLLSYGITVYETKKHNDIEIQ